MPRGWIKGKPKSTRTRTKQSEAQRKRRDKEFVERKESLKVLLSKIGPIPKRELAKKLGCSNHSLNILLRKFPETFRSVKISLGVSSGGSRGDYRYTSYELFNGLSSMHIGQVVWLKGDEKIIEFVGSKVMNPETPGEVHALRHHLNKIFGKRLARKMVEYTGYKYCKGYKY